MTTSARELPDFAGLFRMPPGIHDFAARGVNGYNLLIVYSEFPFRSCLAPIPTMIPKLIGLMMIRDEQDMLAEALRNHVCFCHAIFVLDGSHGQAQRETRLICDAQPQVLGYWHDDETGYEQPLRDGARQFLLERAREVFGVNHWYAVLHGDELWAEDPRSRLTIPKRPYGVATQLYHFFPHTTERKSWSFPGNGSIETTARWYMLPPGPEQRLFFDSGEYDYVWDRHRTTIPPDLPRRTLPIAIKQYNYRSPEQAHSRAKDRQQSGWQENHYQHLLHGPNGFFVNSLAAGGQIWNGWIPTGQGQVTNIVANPLPTLTCRTATPKPQEPIGGQAEGHLDLENPAYPKSEQPTDAQTTVEPDRKSHSWQRRLLEYRDNGHPMVLGWMRKEVFGALEVAQLAHEQLGINGAVVEIGAYHGAFFLALDQLRREGETAAVFDVFSSQELNIDSVGKGDREIFENNLHRYGVNPETVAIVQADSTTLGAEDIRHPLLGQHPRLFSIDGGHTKAHIFSDLSLAEQTLCSGGIVFVDDYMHPAWPEVTEGLHAWMQCHVKLQPFAWVGRKLLMTTIAHRERLFAFFQEHAELITAARYKKASLFGCPILVAIPDWFIG